MRTFIDTKEFDNATKECLRNLRMLSFLNKISLGLFEAYLKKFDKTFIDRKMAKIYNKYKI
jgi:hypothetical protein